MSRRTVAIFLCALASLGLGALREFLFINLNYEIDHVTRHTPFSYAHSMFRGWVDGWPLARLVLLKWGLALAFIAAMLGLSLFLARALFAPRRIDRPIIVVFVAVAFVALMLHGVAHWLPGAETVSVKLLHLLQYPVLLFFLWAASMLGGARRTHGPDLPA